MCYFISFLVYCWLILQAIIGSGSMFFRQCHSPWWWYLCFGLGTRLVLCSLPLTTSVSMSCWDISSSPFPLVQIQVLVLKVLLYYRKNVLGSVNGCCPPSNWSAFGCPDCFLISVSLNGQRKIFFLTTEEHVSHHLCVVCYSLVLLSHKTCWGQERLYWGWLTVFLLVFQTACRQKYRTTVSEFMCPSINSKKKKWFLGKYKNVIFCGIKSMFNKDFHSFINHLLFWNRLE